MKVEDKMKKSVLYVIGFSLILIAVIPALLVFIDPTWISQRGGASFFLLLLGGLIVISAKRKQ